MPDFDESYELPDGLFRSNIAAYDESVVRELLVNALVHRPYTQRGDIFISLYPDRLEITNVGRPVYAFPPLSHSEPERVETVATGVLVRVNSSLFLLTAYHALPKEDSDRGYSLGIRMNDGGIFSLTGQGLGVERGHYSGTKKDTLDFAFYDLSKMDQSPLSKTCVAIEPKDVDLTEKNSYGRVLTHIGYPLKGQDNPLQPGALSLTGYEDSIIPIRNFSYEESVNICMRFSRKSATLKTAGQHRMPHPKGMSGGAIFSWSDSYGDRQAGKGLKLAGIFHAWRERYTPSAAPG